MISINEHAINKPYFFLTANIFTLKRDEKCLTMRQLFTRDVDVSNC